MKLKITLYSVCLLMLLAACQQDGPTPEPSVGSRTVLVYMIAQNSLAPLASADPAAQPLAVPGREGPGILLPEGEPAFAAQLGADQPQQAGLARAAWPYDSHALARRYLQAKRLQDAALAEPQSFPVQRDGDHFSRPAWVAAASMP